jgi:hypothetical protein
MQKTPAAITVEGSFTSFLLEEGDFELGEGWNCGGKLLL